jgi:CheY-like chemotaxis protein
VLVSDIGMPDMNGHALIQAVRALPGSAGQTPAIAFTAYARGEDRTAAMRAGFDMHLTKPIDPAELVVTLSTVVEGVRRRHG